MEVRDNAAPVALASILPGTPFRVAPRQLRTYSTELKHGNVYMRLSLNVKASYGDEEPVPSDHIPIADFQSGRVLFMHGDLSITPVEAYVQVMDPHAAE